MKQQNTQSTTSSLIGKSYMADPLTTTYSLVFFTERNLREQATRIEKKKLSWQPNILKHKMITTQYKSITSLLMTVPPRIQQLILQLTML